MANNVAGTFTDVLVFDEETGKLTEGKVLSTPEDPSKGAVEGIETECENAGIGFTDMNLLFTWTPVETGLSRVGEDVRWRTEMEC